MPRITKGLPGLHTLTVIDRGPGERLVTVDGEEVLIAGGSIYLDAQDLPRAQLELICEPVDLELTGVVELNCVHLDPYRSVIAAARQVAALYTGRRDLGPAEQDLVDAFDNLNGGGQ